MSVRSDVTRRPPRSGSHTDSTSAAKQAIQGGKARNAILLIGDGMGDSEITIVRN